MSDADPTPETDAPPVGASTAEAPPTGVSIVDDVLAGLDGVDRLPVDDRVPAFERAQDGLRRALDEDQQPAPSVDPGTGSSSSPGDDAGA